MSDNINIDVTTGDFDLGEETRRLTDGDTSVGAVCSFVGLVRDFSDKPDVKGLYLEHYPAMTEKSLLKIAEEASQRWDLNGVRVIHRVGELWAGDQIVLVVVASAHRGDAFAACEFIMDYLKVQAPFWKKELTAEGEHWVEAKESDQARAGEWSSESE
ncbi:molybdopterin synthase catalytic subunit MoaE [Hahella sp. KA22]|uniref:molybdopterin synthase catalytic subunit MoaE n=1 Tax=Hahella sp. KA22 TaxID=1628392 RepID=UPI000FDEBD9A|nr:molybdopterin synthase catalytic subunit MoaE [Hahella sp. KA22]AZZ90937.1 molybdopterin synthase catalytic subunit MoaE [Hahella sp. KA22]QAY54307.1 molybdopterin synthase catalytic subunit MoaE [Hahella sp. KA22]